MKEPKIKDLTLYMTFKDYKIIAAHATEHGMSMSAAALDLMRNGLVWAKCHYGLDKD